jgi:hypothetical protein
MREGVGNEKIMDFGRRNVLKNWWETGCICWLFLGNAKE